VNFTAAQLASITAETPVVFGDRDPLYPVSLTVLSFFEGQWAKR
jgi:hypothetical protein